MKSQLQICCNSGIGLAIGLRLIRRGRANVLTLRKRMVGPWGLEPQTSTVSIRSSLIYQQLTGAHRGC
jgi:hypothetical protein